MPELAILGAFVVFDAIAIAVALAWCRLGADGPYRRFGFWPTVASCFGLSVGSMILVLLPCGFVPAVAVWWVVCLRAYRMSVQQVLNVGLVTGVLGYVLLMALVPDVRNGVIR